MLGVAVVVAEVTAVGVWTWLVVAVARPSRVVAVVGDALCTQRERHCGHIHRERIDVYCYIPQSIVSIITYRLQHWLMTSR